jgi:3-oxoacyl-[acyl-carrier protein] reductase
VVGVAPSLATITVSPDPASVQTYGTRQFTAVGRDGNGNVFPMTPVWSVENGGGTINAGSGLFTAGTNTGTFNNTVRATSGSIFGNATVTVTSGSPPPPTIDLGNAAQALLERGDAVTISARNAAEVEEAGRRLEKRHPGKVLALTCDVRRDDQVEAMMKRTEERFGGLDVLVNNAGISLPATIDSPDYEERWSRGLDVLLTAHVRTVRAALPYLRRSSSPRIINIASTEGLGATPRASAYTAAKTGVIGLTRGLAVELGREGITVNCICPGPIRTGMTEAIPEEAKDEYARRRTALRRYGDPEEVAQMTLSLALPAASFVTGVALPVDGGLTIRRA